MTSIWFYADSWYSKSQNRPKMSDLSMRYSVISEKSAEGHPNGSIWTAQIVWGMQRNCVSWILGPFDTFEPVKNWSDHAYFGRERVDIYFIKRWFERITSNLNHSKLSVLLFVGIFFKSPKCQKINPVDFFSIYEIIWPFWVFIKNDIFGNYRW